MTDHKEQSTKKKVSIAALGDVTHLKSARVLHLVSPNDLDQPLFLDDDPSKPIQIKLFGNESDTATKANHENRRINTKRALTGLDFDPEVEDNNTLRYMAMTTQSWSNVPTCWLQGGDGMTPAPYTIENAMLLYKRLGWVRRQFQACQNKSEPFGEAS